MNRIFKYGMENFHIVDKVNFKFRFKIFMFNFLSIFLQKRVKEVKNETVGLSFHPRHTKILNDKSELVFETNSCLSNFDDFRLKNGMLSIFPIYYRIFIFLKSIFTYILNIKVGNYLSFYIDFCNLDAFIKNISSKNINVCCHYDRYATWLSFLGEKYNKKINVYQHGTLIVLKKSPIIHKLNFASFYGYNEGENNAFMKYLSSNKNCKLYILPFKSEIKFTNINTDKVKIGIVSENNYEIEKMIIEKLIIHKNCLIVLMLHPSTHEERYKNLVYENLIVTNKDKYINFDYVIIGNSTMFYDYEYSNYKGQIITYDPNTIFLKIFDNIKYFDFTI